MLTQTSRSRIVLLFSLLTLVGCRGQNVTSSSYPQRPIKLIVPFGAGGGSDTFARILAKAIEENNLLPQPLVIINVPGAGGTIGSRRLKNSRPDGYTLMQLHEGIITSKYSGRVSYGPEAFEVVAGMGHSTMVIAVGQNSRFQNLNELMQAASVSPDEVIFSANIGAPSQFVGLMLEKVAPGARFRYSQTGDGAKRFAGLQGGHTDVSSFSLAEYIQFKPSGLRAIALLGPKRNPDAIEVPTALEQGYDVQYTNMQFWWAPKGTLQENLGIVAVALEKAMQTPEVQASLAQLNIEPVVVLGDKVADEIKNRSVKASAVSQRPTVKLPDFPVWIITVVVLLTIAAVLTSRIKEENVQKATTPRVGKSLLAVGVLLITVLYVATMQLNLLGYQPATFVYLLVLGFAFAARDRKLLAAMALLSVILSFGLYYLFTEVFVIDLP